RRTRRRWARLLEHGKPPLEQRRISLREVADLQTEVEAGHWFAIGTTRKFDHEIVEADITCLGGGVWQFGHARESQDADVEINGGRDIRHVKSQVVDAFEHGTLGSLDRGPWRS